MAQHRDDIEVTRTRETADKIVRDARQSYEAHIIDHETYRRILDAAIEDDR
jgi:hypothetical protein